MLKRYLVILILSTAVIYGCQKNDQPGEKISEMQQNAEVNTGNNPDFVLKDINGQDIKLSDYRGKIVLLDFWATWCPPCRKGIPDLIALQNKYKDDLVVIGISLDQQNTIDEVVPFTKSYGINYPVVYGNGAVVQKFGGVEAIPTSFIIDKEGNVVNKYVGLTPIEVYEKNIESLN